MHPERSPADENYWPNVAWTLLYVALGITFFVFMFVWSSYWIGHVVASLGAFLLAYKYALLVRTQYRLKKDGEKMERHSK